MRATEVDRLHNAAAAEDRVRTDYAGRSVIELLQNAHDACADAGVTGRVWLVLTTSALIVANQGAAFDKKRVHSLIQLGDSSKRAGQSDHHTIGYKGVGFTAVLELSDCPQVVSRKFAFGFDRTIAAKKVAEVLGQEPRGVPLRYFPFPLAQVDLGDDADEVARLLDLGAVSVIRLPLRDDAAVAAVRHELTEGLRPETLLFMPSLNRLTIQMPEDEIEWSLRAGQERGTGRVMHLRRSGGQTESWLLARRDVAVPRQVVRELDDPLWAGVRSLVTAVAVPWRNGQPDPHRPPQPVHVYFPTDDRLGRSLLVHGDYYVHSSRRRITLDGPGRAVTDLVADTAAELIAELAISLREHGNDLVRVLAPAEQPEGFGVVLAARIDEKLSTTEFLKAATAGTFLSPLHARIAAAELPRRAQVAVVDLLGTRADLLDPGIHEGCQAWLSAMGAGPLTVQELSGRLEPGPGTEYDALLSTLATWHATLGWSDRNDCRRLLAARPVLQDQDGRWRRPGQLMSFDSRTPTLPPALARAVYVPPRSTNARKFADEVLHVQRMTPESALDEVLTLVGRSPEDRELKGVLDFLRALWRDSRSTLTSADSKRLSKVPVPVRTVGGDHPLRGFGAAGAVYFTRHWTTSQTLERLYGPFRRKEFLDVPPPKSGLEDDRRFWMALGVSVTPRLLPIDQPGQRSAWWHGADVAAARVCPDGHRYTLREAHGEAIDRLEDLLRRQDDRTLHALASHLLGQSGDVPWGGVVLGLVRRGDRDVEGHRAMVSETGLGNSRKDIARWPWTSLPCSTCSTCLPH